MAWQAGNISQTIPVRGDIMRVGTITGVVLPQPQPKERVATGVVLPQPQPKERVATGVVLPQPQPKERVATGVVLPQPNLTPGPA